MSCLSPIKKTRRTAIGDTVTEFPCGKCRGCLSRRRREWTARILLESFLHSFTWFVTLTYSDENIPEHGSLRKEDYQKWMKRLRKKLDKRKKKIRYYGCGEYGEKTNRPHYHAIIFGNLDVRINNEGHYYSPDIESTWIDVESGSPLGHHQISIFNENRAAYCAGYTTKKLDSASQLSASVPWFEPEFTLMSKNPGIGLEYGARLYNSIASKGAGIKDTNQRGDTEIDLKSIKIGKSFYPLSRTLKQRIIDHAGGESKTDTQKAREQDWNYKIKRELLADSEWREYFDEKERKIAERIAKEDRKRKKGTTF
jgi:hypothetical protein